MAAAWRVREQGGRRRLKEAAGISACERGKGIPGDLAGHFGRGCGAGKGRREEVLTGGAGLSAEAAAERERAGAEWAAVRAGTGMCGAGCGRGLGRAGAGVLGPAQEGKKRARASAGGWAERWRMGWFVWWAAGREEVAGPV